MKKKGGRIGPMAMSYPGSLVGLSQFFKCVRYENMYSALGMGGGGGGRVEEAGRINWSSLNRFKTQTNRKTVIISIPAINTKFIMVKY